MQGKPQGNLLGSEAIQQAEEMYAWKQRHMQGGGNLPTEPFTKFGARLIRIARTTTSAAFPTYPARPANTFVIEFGETSFTETPGLQTLTFTAYDPAEKRIAHALNCVYHEEGTIVLVTLVHDQWYIVGGQDNLLAIGTLTADLCGAATASVTGVQLLPSCIDTTITSATNPRKHRGKSGDKVLLVKKMCLTGTGSTLQNCSAATEEWEIVDIQLQTFCTVVGIDSRESGLVAAGLQMGGEFCTADQPITACLIVDYIDCDEDLPPIDLSWTFTPLYACCGQGSWGGASGGSSGASSSPARRGSPGIQKVPGAVPGRFPRKHK